MMSSTPRTFVGSATFRVAGMTCGRCQAAVTHEVAAVDGVDRVAVDLPTGTVTVHVERPVDRSLIAAALDEAGYPLVD
jgi:copper chaperone CopZ